MADDKLICRCEEVTETEILQAIKDGAVAFDEIKRLTRAGMGHCQGSTCSILVDNLLRSANPGITLHKHTPRPPLQPVKLEAFVKSASGSQGEANE